MSRLPQQELTALNVELGELTPAVEAYNALQSPLVVTDDSWIIPGLNGFPGPYMKQVNDWFTPDDWLHLTSGLADRRVILRQIIVYQDSTGQRLK